MSTGRSMARLIRGDAWWFVLNVTLWGIVHASGLVGGLIMRMLFDALTGQRAAGWDAWSLLGLSVTTDVVRMAVVGGSAWAWWSYWLRLLYVPRENIVRWLVSGPGARTLPGAPGEALNRFRDDTEELGRYAERWVDGVGLIALAAGATAVMWRVNPVVTATVALPLVLVVAAAQALSGTVSRYRRAHRKAAARVAASIGELFDAVQAIKTAGAEDGVVLHLRRLNEARRKVALRDALLSHAMMTLFWSLGHLATGGVLLLAAGAVRSGSFTVGDLVMFSMFLPRVTMALTFVGDMIAQHRKTGVALGRLEDLCAGAPEGTIVSPCPADDSEGESDLAPLKGIEVRGLSYRYPKPADAAALEGTHARRMAVGSRSAPVEKTEHGIEDVGLTVRRGEVVVITGRIGSGKTTLLRCLLGLVKADGGAVLWNGEQVVDPATALLPPRVGYTPQAPRLFAGSLRDNIVAGYTVSEAGLDEALRLAVMDQDIAELEHGLNTTIGARGVKLSGGQVQRGAAARMLVREPDLLVIDDLSSALDVETEERMWAGLAARGATCLAVSHRHAALTRADRIIVLREGRVHAEGRLEALMETCEEMQRLWHGDVG